MSPLLAGFGGLFQISRDESMVLTRHVKLFALARPLLQPIGLLQVFLRELALAQVVVASSEGNVCQAEIRVEIDGALEEWKSGFDIRVIERL